MEVSDQQWSEMVAKVEKLEKLAIVHGELIQVLSDLVGRHQTTIANQIGLSENLSGFAGHTISTIEMTMDRLQRHDDTIGSLSEAVISRPMPGEPSSN